MRNPLPSKCLSAIQRPKSGAPKNLSIRKLRVWIAGICGRLRMPADGCANLRTGFRPREPPREKVPYEFSWARLSRHVSGAGPAPAKDGGGGMTKTANIRATRVRQTGPTFEPFLDKREVGRRLRAASRTVEDWMRRGLLPYYRVGGSVRFKWSEIEAHLSQHCRVCLTPSTKP